MKKLFVSLFLVCLTFFVFGQDRIIYIQKQNLNAKQLSDLQNGGNVVDEITLHTNVSIIEKIRTLEKNWSRDAMNDLLQDFSLSPEQFGMMIDTLSNVIIRQSNDIPNTKVGKIALTGFAWKIAGPTIFKFVTDILFIVFFLWFFIWSYKRNFWTKEFISKKKKGVFGTVLTKHKVDDVETLFDGDDLLSSSDGPFDDSIVASKFLHICGFVLFLLVAIFVL